jgi:hypothetical protein
MKIGLSVLGLLVVLALRGVRADEPATTAPAAAVPADGKADNPLYLAWGKFDVGVSVTLEGDMDKDHVSATLTLKSKDAAAATVDVVSQKPNNGGDSHTETNTVPAKVDCDDVKQLKDEQVTVMDKPIKCRVYQATDVVVGGTGNTKMTLYVSDDIPGGIVKMVVHEGDKDGTLVVTAVKKN